jgi:anti-sigma factor RsiW
MNRHLDDAELLEAWYLEEADGDAADHLASCERCNAQLLEVVALVREGAAEDERPESFWQRQRLSIERRIERETVQAPAWRRVANIAAAAMLTLVLGGLLLFRSSAPEPERPALVTQSASVTAAAEAQVLEYEGSKDPWESEELESFGNVVEWESWVEKTPAKGEQPL